MVTAVPGAGKTATLTERIKALVRRGVDPASILAITFTNKAAREMKSRIASVVGAAASGMTVCTFHSLCARILRQHAEKVDLKSNFTIYDGDQQERLMLGCVSLVMGEDYANTKVYALHVLRYIEGQRNALLTKAQADKRFGLKPQQVQVMEKYFARLRQANAIDFTGLLHQTIRLFEAHPAIADHYSNAYRFISVDEVQDTNIAQYRLVKYLAGEHKNVLCVGDVFQSVYGFRNANPDNVLQFRDEFDAKVLKLEKNYRSTPQILAHSQALIDKNASEFRMRLTTDNSPGAKVGLITGETDQSMADILAENLKKRITDGVDPNEIAVLYRTNYAARALEQALRLRGVPYRVYGGMSFFKRREVKNALSILKTMDNPQDELAFEEACEACCRGVGPRTLERVGELVGETTSWHEAGKRFAESKERGAAPLRPFVEKLESAKGMPPHEGLEMLVRDTCFADRLRDQGDRGNDRLDNVMEVVRDLERHVLSGEGLSEYLQLVSLLGSADDEAEKGEVSLMTMHMSKGLEFDVVYVSHAVDGVVPHNRCLEEADDEEDLRRAVEEERRLFYVAMTRARKVLVLARYAYARQGNRHEPVHPSRFLYDAKILP